MKQDLLKEFPGYEDLINEKVNKVSYDNLFLEETSNISSCTARVWNKHRGTRCSNLRCGERYCKTHENMINKHGKLLFGDYFRDNKPLYKDGNKLQWFDYSEKEELDILFRYQNMRLLDIISKNEKLSKSILYLKYREIIGNN
jgi:hypothetical protein